MSKLNKYYKLEEQAEKYYQKHSNKCDEIFHLISPMIEIDKDDFRTRVFRQAGDGYVLYWEGKDFLGDNISFNTPIENIIEEYERQNQPLSVEELREISI